MFHIKWSLSNDGFVEVYIDGKLHAKKQGRNMWNDYPHYLKLGLYRHKSIRHASTVYYDEVRIGKSREAVSIADKTSSNLNFREGDRVVTEGGIHGIVHNLRNDVVDLEISKNVKITIDRSSIASVR